MSFFRYHITPQSAFGTPLQSDTLLGHILCAVRMLDGEAALSALIDQYKAGNAPFLVSSAFPQGMLPMPLIPQASRSEFQAFVTSRGEYKGSLFKALSDYKKFKKIKFIPCELFCKHQGQLNQLSLFECWLDNKQSFESKRTEKEFQPHNSIDRNTSTVPDEGGLYFSESIWHELGAIYDLYLKTDDVSAFERYFDYLADTGYGADRSTGKGFFSFTRDETFDAVLFEKKLSHRMTLSLCSNNDLSGFRGTYSTITKYGKVWNGFGEKNPFKKPFLAFSEGAVFSAMPHDGYVLKNIHSNPAIVQITMPLTFPASLEVRDEI